jgi:large subunit ribosomal protein L13e
MPETIPIKRYSHAMNRSIMPIPKTARADAVKVVAKSKMPKGEEGGAYRRLRIARSDARLVGSRERRSKAKADAAEALKK